MRTHLAEQEVGSCLLEFLQVVLQLTAVQLLFRHGKLVELEQIASPFQSNETASRFRTVLIIMSLQVYNHERRMSAASARQNPSYGGMMSTELMTTAGAAMAAAAAAAAERPQTLELPLTPRTPLR